MYKTIPALLTEDKITDEMFGKILIDEPPLWGCVNTDGSKFIKHKFTVSPIKFKKILRSIRRKRTIFSLLKNLQ